MNDFQSMQTGRAMLKDNYESAEQGRNALTEALRQRRKKLAETRLGSVYEEPLSMVNDVSSLNKPGRGL